MTTRIEQLEAMPIYGNAHDDRDILNLAHEIAIDEREPLEHRIRAIRKLDATMGHDAVDVTEADVTDYAAFAKENL